MQLDWIDDILAVIDTGSLSHAAERRYLTQSAFTRRVRTIEARIGTELFDRSSKPITLLPGVRAMEPELRTLSARLRRLQHDLKAAVDGGGREITFVCQHAITTTMSPWIVKELTAKQDLSVRVLSGNRDQCLMLLLSHAADFAITYERPDDPDMPQGFETHRIGADVLVPVLSPALLAQLGPGPLPAISYPTDVFLGQIVTHSILPALPEGITLSPKAETALTLAACEYALDGIGVAWLPLSLVQKYLDRGQLELASDLPDETLNIMLIRLTEPQNDRMTGVWEHLTQAHALKARHVIA